MEREKEVMNLREASQYLGISPDTLYKYLGESKIPAFKLGNRWRFKKDLLDRRMERKSDHTLVVDSKAKSVSTHVTGHSVIVKRVVMPTMTTEEVQASIQIDTEQYIPFDSYEVTHDYHIVATTMTTEDDAIEVMLVTAKKVTTQNHTNV